MIPNNLIKNRYTRNESENSEMSNKNIVYIHMKIYNLQLKEWLHIEEGARDHKRWNHNNLLFVK